LRSCVVDSGGGFEKMLWYEAKIFLLAKVEDGSVTHEVPRIEKVILFKREVELLSHGFFLRCGAVLRWL